MQRRLFVPAALFAGSLATLALVVGNINSNDTDSQTYSTAREYAQGFAKGDLEEPRVVYIGNNKVNISSANVEGVGSTLSTYLPQIESLFGEFPCKEYSLFTADFGYVSQSSDCVSIIDNRALYEDTILEEALNQYTKDIHFPMELAWLKYGFAGYATREIRNSWDLFDQIYKNSYRTDAPASRIGPETHGSEWSYYAWRSGIDIFRSSGINLSDLWKVVNSVDSDSTSEDVVDRLSAYAPRDALERKITG